MKSTMIGTIRDYAESLDYSDINSIADINDKVPSITNMQQWAKDSNDYIITQSEALYFMDAAFRIIKELYTDYQEYMGDPDNFIQDQYDTELY